MDGHFHGNGKYEFADGSSYDGEWAANKMHGRGKYIDSMGGISEGDFFNGAYSTGSSYVSLRPGPKKFGLMK